MQFLWTFCCLLSYLLFKAQIKLTPFAHSKKRRWKLSIFVEEICFKSADAEYSKFVVCIENYFCSSEFLCDIFLSFGSCFDSIYVISYVSILLLSVVSHCFLVFVSLVSSLVFLIYTSCFYCGKNFSLCLVYFNLLLLFLFYDFFLLSISLCVYTVLSFSFVGLEF